MRRSPALSAQCLDQYGKRSKWKFGCANGTELMRLMPRPDGTAYASKVFSIDITGTVAAAKLTDRCFGHNFTDYLTLIKPAGGWQIVTKSYSLQPHLTQYRRLATGGAVGARADPAGQSDRGCAGAAGLDQHHRLGPGGAHRARATAGSCPPGGARRLSTR